MNPEIKAIQVHGITVVIAHIVSFRLVDNDGDHGEKIRVLEIQMITKEKISAVGSERDRAYSELRQAFGLE